MAFETFDLGRVLATAEGIKGMRREGAMDQLRQKYMGVQIDNAQQAGQIAQSQEGRAQAAEGRAQAQFSQEQMFTNTRTLNVAAKSVAANPASIGQWLPVLREQGVLSPDFDPSSASPEELQRVAQDIAAQTDATLGAYIQSDPRMAAIDMEHQNRLQQIMAQAGATSGLQAQQHRYRMMEAQQPSEQFVTLSPEEVAAAGLPPNSAAQRNVQTGQIQVLSRGENKAQNDAANERTFEVYRVGMDNLRKALEGTATGPLVGRTPAMTASQQTADGAVAAMAPVLKQMFRSAGEGVFTDRDQALLLEMLPQRTDQPEAREAKMAGIDAIVAAKLGMTRGGAGGASGGWSVQVVQ